MNYTEPRYGFTKESPSFLQFVNVLATFPPAAKKVIQSHYASYDAYDLSGIPVVCDWLPNLAARWPGEPASSSHNRALGQRWWHVPISQYVIALLYCIQMLITIDVCTIWNYPSIQARIFYETDYKSRCFQRGSTSTNIPHNTQYTINATHTKTYNEWIYSYLPSKARRSVACSLFDSWPATCWNSSGLSAARALKKAPSSVCRSGLELRFWWNNGQNNITYK